MAETIIEARNVTKLYPQFGGSLQRPVGTIVAVDHFSCGLKRGETLGLVGESGCGKTTLAKLCIGLLIPSGGDIFVRGQSWIRLRGEELRATRRSVQFVFQDPMNSLNPRMSVEDILSEPLIIHRLVNDRAQRRQHVGELLELVQLPASYGKRFPRELSGGERQRVGIARALATSPEALICDEPIASLDVSVGAQIIELLRQLCCQRQMALLFISHDLRAVASICERVAVMRQGRLLEVGYTEEILERPGHPYTELLIRSAELDLNATLTLDRSSEAQ